VRSSPVQEKTKGEGKNRQPVTTGKKHNAGQMLGGEK